MVKRALPPVGAGLGLVEAQSQQLLHKVGIADVVGESRQPGRHLGIEQIHRQTTVDLMQHLEILSRGVQILG